MSANAEAEGEEEQPEKPFSSSSSSPPPPPPRFAEYFFQAGLPDNSNLFLRRLLPPEELQHQKLTPHSSLALSPSHENLDYFNNNNPSEDNISQVSRNNGPVQDTADITGSEALLQQVMATIDKFDREREEASKDIARTWNDKNCRRGNLRFSSLRSLSFTDVKLPNDKTTRPNQQPGSTRDTVSIADPASEIESTSPSGSLKSSEDRTTLPSESSRHTSQRSKSLDPLLEPSLMKADLPPQRSHDAPEVEETVSGGPPHRNASSPSVGSSPNPIRSPPRPNPPPHRFFPKSASNFATPIHQASPGLRSSLHSISLTIQRHPIEYKYYPEVISSFPPTGETKPRNSNKDEKKEHRSSAPEGLPKYLSMFCFPNDISLVHQPEESEIEMEASKSPQSSKNEPRWHSFVITEDANTKFYGVCITIWERLSPALQAQLDEWCKLWREDNVSDSDIEYVNHVRSQIQQEQSVIARARERIRLVAKRESTPTSSIGADSKQEPISTTVSSTVTFFTNINSEPFTVAGNSATVSQLERNDVTNKTDNAAGSILKCDIPQPVSASSTASESGRKTPSISGPTEKSLPPLPVDVTSSAHAIANEEKESALQSIADSEEKILLYRELLKPFQNSMLVDSRRIFVPRVIGVVSRWPWYELLKEWVSGLVLGWDGDLESGDIESHIVNLLYEVPVPPPGKLEVSLQCPGFPRRRLYCSRPALNEVPIIRNISFYPFFRALSHINIIRVFETALTEGKIIFVSSHLSMLGLATEVVSYLLFPLKFQGICVPVLPCGLLDYLEAPVPYIVGVGRDWWYGDKDVYSGIEDACIVDLDTNTLSYTGNADRLTLPPKHRRKLLARLKKAAPHHSMGVPYGVPESMQKVMPYGRMATSGVTDSRLGKKTSGTNLSRRSSLGDSVSTNSGSVTGLDRRKSTRSAVASAPDGDVDVSLPNDVYLSSSRRNPHHHPRGPRPSPVDPPITSTSRPSAERRNSIAMPSIQLAGPWKKAVGALSKRGEGHPELSEASRNQKGSLSAFFVKHSRGSSLFSPSGALDSGHSSAWKRRSLEAIADPSPGTSSTADVDQSTESEVGGNAQATEESACILNPSRSDENGDVGKRTETASLKRMRSSAKKSRFALFSPSSGDGDLSRIPAPDVILRQNSEEISPPKRSAEENTMVGRSDSPAHANQPPRLGVDEMGTSNGTRNGSEQCNDGRTHTPEVVLSNETFRPLFATGPLPGVTSGETLPCGDNSSSLLWLPLSASHGHGGKPLSSSGSLLSFGTAPTDVSGSTNLSASATEISRTSASDPLLCVTHGGGGRLEDSKATPTRSASVTSRRSSVTSYLSSPHPSQGETLRRLEERKEGHVFLQVPQEVLSFVGGVDPYPKDDVCCVVCDQDVHSSEGDVVMRCDACGTSIHRKCISQWIRPCFPASFDEPKVLESFLKLFSSLFRNYRTFLHGDPGPDDDELFKKEAFLDTVDREAKPFMTQLVESQCFAQFVLERHERSSNDYEILFFDEVVKAKANRSRLKLAKEATPFLKDPAYAVASTYDSLSPTGTERSDSIKSLDRFSRRTEPRRGTPRFPTVLSPESYPSPRPVPTLMTEEEARILRIHTGAITRRARMALTKKQSKWMKLRVNAFPWKQPEPHPGGGDGDGGGSSATGKEKRSALDHKLERAYSALRNAQRTENADKAENRRAALNALESELRELRGIRKNEVIDRSNQDDIEAITRQMEDTIVRLKASLESGGSI